jgi:hypothetical protein
MALCIRCDGGVDGLKTKQPIESLEGAKSAFGLGVEQRRGAVGRGFNPGNPIAPQNGVLTPEACFSLLEKSSKPDTISSFADHFQHPGIVNSEHQMDRPNRSARVVFGPENHRTHPPPPKNPLLKTAISYKSS